jgi:hypothetical protein
MIGRLRHAQVAIATVGHLLIMPSAFADDMVKGTGVRNNVWSVGMTGKRHSLKSGEGNELLGNSAAVQLGKGYISESWYASISLDILLGPYEPSQGGQLNVDYVGTGTTIWTGFSAQTLDLRSEAGGYGFAMGLSYADFVGRSLGKNRRDSGNNTPEDQELIDNYVNRVTELAVLPGIFFSWLKPGRPRSNTPELLTTRLEGFFMTIGVAMPVISSYQAQYDKRSQAEPIREKGRLRGYSLLVSVTSHLGT